MLNLIQGKTIPILMLLTSIASASGASFVAHSVWKAKYLEVKLELAEGKASEIKDIYEQHLEKQNQVIADYHAALDVVNSIVQLRNAEQEQAEQKYRSLYARYTQIQRQNPASSSCDIDSDRSNILMQVGRESNEARDRLAASIKTQAPASIQPSKSLPNSTPDRARTNTSG
jgi:ATP/maltotriose-dependent transcriptional regulator MalT